jgi:imidazolonepropionase-like amidohydrolase
MKKILLGLTLIAAFNAIKAQETVYPAPPQSQDIALVHAAIHTGTGEVIEDGMITFSKGKITSVGKYSQPGSDAKVIDCTGKQIYPGLITPVTDLGLNEIGAVRSTVDEYELGENNSNVRSVIAYNTDSKVINTLRSNGILLANVVPDGGIISGSSSVMQLDGWNWEDAVYKTDGGIHFRMPSLAVLPARFGGGRPGSDVVKAALDRIEKVRQFLQEAKAYFEEPKHEHTNIKFEAVKGLFTQTQTFYVHCDLVKEMMIATSFAKEFNLRTVIVGGADSWMIADYLKQNNIAVILGETLGLPVTQDDDVNQTYKTPFMLQQAGVLFALSDQHGETRGRNLMFNAGNAVRFGLTKEQALEAITINAAKILGIDATTGTIEKGKDANIIVSDGDVLDITTNNIIYAFIQGRQLNLDNKHKQLYEKYKYKYGLK